MTLQAVAWHCQHLEVTDLSSGETWLFPCDAWLGSSQAAGAADSSAIEPVARRQLQPAPSLEGLFKQRQQELEQEQAQRCKVAVYTSDLPPQTGRPCRGVQSIVR